jgi:two-component system sensor histidine kinase CreC
LLILILVVGGSAGYFLTLETLKQIRPRYIESMEETLIDTSVLLASVLETHLVNGHLDAGVLEKALGAAQQREFKARVFSLEKTHVDLRVYVTDAAGKVVYDSDGRDVGRDFSQWNDVRRTLRGEYGARSSRTLANDDNTQTIYVAAPIRDGAKIVGVVSVGKPTAGINHLVVVAKQRVLYGAIVGGLLVVLVLGVAASWVVAPIERLTHYAQAVRDGKTVAPPALPGRTLRELARSFEEMRDALAGRKHAERYTQAFAHEVKAPLSAIRGAAELLGEEMPAEQRRRFLENIRGEVERIQRIVDRLLELTSIEARKALQKSEPLRTRELVDEAVSVVRASYAAARVNLVTASESSDVSLTGERVLLREALVNLLQNAQEFSPVGGEVVMRCVTEGKRVTFVIEDRGTGVPEYALPRIFERFYSLPRPSTNRKSTGIGLALVREIAILHGGDATLENREGGGARATLWLPA